MFTAYLQYIVSRNPEIHVTHRSDLNLTIFFTPFNIFFYHERFSLIRVFTLFLHYILAYNAETYII